MLNNQTENLRFAIAGIGASAGGLQALEEFLKAVPSHTGIAFIIVQHLSPDYKSELPNILANYTEMSVYAITDGMLIQPDTVYVIPPGYNLDMRDGKLYLLDIDAPRTVPAKIDFFFQSLAINLWEFAIGIILSGSGTDGTNGLRAIKEYGGMTMAQSPESATYDSMPRHAINSKLVDFVAPSGELPALLIEFVEKWRDLRAATEIPDNTAENLSRILRIIHHHSGNDFSSYKTNTLLRRISRRMVINKINNLSDYVSELPRNRDEREQLFLEFLIGVTRFFRDPLTFQALRELVFMNWYENLANHDKFRIWVSGCSTGEEAYSIAMLLSDVLGQGVLENKVQIFATDINSASIAHARQAIYPVHIEDDLPAGYLAKYFMQEPDGYRVKSNIRKVVIFAVHNVLQDPPFSHLDLISCRNVLIYMQADAQKKVFSIVQYALKSDGVLFLGNSEALGASHQNFQTIDNNAKLFRLLESHANRHSIFDLSDKATSQKFTRDLFTMTVTPKDLKSSIEKLLLQDFVAPCVIVDSQGKILYFHNRTGKYLEPVEGTANLNVLEMARQGLKMSLTTAFHNAVRDHQSVRYDNVEVRTNGDTQTINLIIHYIEELEVIKGLFLIMFEDVKEKMIFQPEDLADDSQLSHEQYLVNLETKLKSTQDFLQTTREELETSNEELKSTNEELQSANEELQSSNEELETSKEELSSVNEELLSSNTELQIKIESFARANNDLQNLLNSIQVGIIFLDTQLNIQRFNPAINRLFNVINSDIGRSITHITSNFEQENLLQDIHDVLENLTSRTLEISTIHGNWFVMSIRPYRTVDNVIDGVVITFNEISEQKKSQISLNQQSAYTDAIINTIRHPFIVLDDNYKIISSNQSFYNFFQVSSAQTVGETLFDLGNGQWDIVELRDLLEKLTMNDSIVEEFIVEQDFPVIGYRKVIVNMRRLDYVVSDSNLILLAIEDISEKN